VPNVASRKFILTIVYAIIFVLNYALSWGVPWEALLALAVMFGIYDVANAVTHNAYAKADAEVATAQIYKDA
jgi:hypothetical protein